MTRVLVRWGPMDTAAGRHAGNQQRKSGGSRLRETKEQSCLIKCPRNVAYVPLLVKSSILDAHV